LTFYGVVNYNYDVKFILNKRKAAQAAAYLVKLHSGKMDLLLLIKLLYLADRTALIKAGYSITGDKMVSMEWGPVLSGIYDATKPKHREDDLWWHDYISERQETTLYTVKDDSETDELSQFELKILDEVYQKYGHMDPFQLSEWTHTLPEYADPHGGSLPIDPTIILKDAGKSEEEIRELTQLSEEVAFLKSLQK
jgi:uncharacterized phage-associated protein